MRHMNWSAVAGVVVFLSACGGGGIESGTSGSTATSQSAGGIWSTQYTVTSGTNTGDVVDAEGIITENGQYFVVSKNTNNGCAVLGFGQLSVDGANISGNEAAAIVQYATIPGVTPNCVYPDGSSSGTASITGTVSQRTSLSITEMGTTSLGTTLPTDTTTWTFSDLYMNPSSLATIAGNYSDGSVTLNINGSGVVFEQDANGCVINGQVSTINTSYNAYAVQISVSNCTGADAALNGASFSGLATLDTNTSPATLLAGVNGNVGGEPYALFYEFPKM
jgi:hypothetical protein